MQPARRKRAKPPVEKPAEPRPAFAWPSREDAAQRASDASAIADAALVRLRAAHEAGSPPRDAIPARAPVRPANPDPWSREFDELADRLVDELSRDLGPARDRDAA